MTKPDPLGSVRWGIIGCGDVTEVKSGPAFAKAERSALVAVMRRTAHLARDYAARHGVPRWYDDAESLVHDPDVDAVYIATPPDAHKDLTLLCARAGKPVYVEKPMALDAAECDTMIETCRAAGVPLFVAYYRRALPRFLKVKSLIDDGAIGAVRAVHVVLCRRLEPPGATLSWRVDPARASGGHFVDLACHTLDLLDLYLGPVTAVAGDAANQSGRYAAEDIVTASLAFASGARGTGLWCFSADCEVDTVEIFGADGRLTFATFADVPVTLARGGAIETFAIPHPPHIQQPFIQSIVDELTGRGRCPGSAGSAARTTRVMDALLHAYYLRLRP